MHDVGPGDLQRLRHLASDGPGKAGPHPGPTGQPHRAEPVHPHPPDEVGLAGAVGSRPEQVDGVSRLRQTGGEPVGELGGAVDVLRVLVSAEEDFHLHNLSA